MWSINSTAIGGGVAEFLRTMLPYARAGGLDGRWLIARAGADFFRVTKPPTRYLTTCDSLGSALDRRC